MAYDASAQYEAPRRAYMQPSTTPAGPANMRQPQYNEAPHNGYDAQYDQGQQYAEPAPVANGGYYDQHQHQQAPPLPQQGYQNNSPMPPNGQQRRVPPPRGPPQGQVPPGQYNERPPPPPPPPPGPNGPYRGNGNMPPAGGGSGRGMPRDGGMQRGQGGPPGNSRGGPGGPMGLPRGRGGPPPGNMQRPPPQNRPSTSEGRYAGPPPIDQYDEMPRRGPTQQGRGRPSNANFHRPRPPPQAAQTYQGQGQGQEGQYYDQGYDQGHNGRRMSDASTKRSNTMPNAYQADYHLANGTSQSPPRHNQHQPPPAARQNTLPYDDGYYGDFKTAGPGAGRESVNDVLDMYTHPQDERAYQDDRANSLTNNFHAQQPEHNGNYGMAYSQHPPPLDRSKSQPNIRGAYKAPPHDPYAAPPLPRPGPGYNNQMQNGGFEQQQQQQPPPMQYANGPNGNYEGRLPMNGNGPPRNPNQPSMPYGQQPMPANNNMPPRSSSSMSSSNGRPPPGGQHAPYNGNALAGNISSMSLNSNQDPNRQSLDPDALPAHPAPIRPGLLPGAPPPQRSYTPSIAGSTRSTGAPPPPPPDPRLSGPLTLSGLEGFRREAGQNPLNPGLQLQFAKKLIEAAQTLADDGGRLDSKTAKRNRDNYIMESHKTIKKLITGQHPYPEAMFFMATCYGDGSLGLEVDHEKAFNLYQSGAKLNHPPSAYRTAVCCEIGAGTRKEPVKAYQWYKKAASMGDTAAMYKTGMILYKGLLGQPRNVREAITWLKRAAEQADEDNPHALHQLGLLYESAEPNDTIIRDIPYAMQLFQKAAELGYIPSQFKLGNAYAYGSICPVDAKLSITWFSRAAAKGDPESELALSGWYLTGAEGVLEQSDTEAYLWARKSAEKGLAKAEYGVGHFTELGIGLGGVGNEEEAKKWYFRAAGQGHPKAQARLQELQRSGGKKNVAKRERLSRSNKAKDDADCVIV